MTQSDDSQTWSEVHQNKVICKISAQYVKVCRRKVRKTGGRTETRTDGWTESRTDGDPDGHHHTIIRPVWGRAYKNGGLDYEKKSGRVSCDWNSGGWVISPCSSESLGVKKFPKGEICLLLTFHLAIFQPYRQWRKNVDLLPGKHVIHNTISLTNKTYSDSSPDVLIRLLTS